MNVVWEVRFPGLFLISGVRFPLEGELHRCSGWVVFLFLPVQESMMARGAPIVSRLKVWDSDSQESKTLVNGMARGDFF